MSTLVKRRKENNSGYESSTSDDEETPVRSAPRRKKMRKVRPTKGTVRMSEAEEVNAIRKKIEASPDGIHHQEYLAICNKYAKLREELRNKEFSEWSEQRKLERTTESTKNLDEMNKSAEIRAILAKYSKLRNELGKKESAELREHEGKKSKQTDSETSSLSDTD